MSLKQKNIAAMGKASRKEAIQEKLAKRQAAHAKIYKTTSSANFTKDMIENGKWSNYDSDGEVSLSSTQSVTIKLPKHPTIASVAKTVRSNITQPYGSGARGSLNNPLKGYGITKNKDLKGIKTINIPVGFNAFQDSEGNVNYKEGYAVVLTHANKNNALKKGGK